MNTIEDRIRDAFRAADTWTPDTPPPLAFPAARRRTRRWVAPLAAAVALLIVVGTAYAVRQASSPDNATTGARPAFVLSRDPGDMAGSRHWTTVRDSATGRIVTRLDIAAAQLAGTGDGRTFFAASSTSRTATEATFSKIVLRADGRLRSMTGLAVPPVRGRIESLAASADGTKIAYSVQGGVPRGALYLADVPTGRTTRLRSSADSVIRSASMDAAGRLVAFTEESLNNAATKVCVLDLTRPDTKPLVIPLGKREYPDAVAMRPDGVAVAVGEQGGGGDRPDRIVEYPIAGGEPRVLATAPLVTEPRGDETAIITGVSVVDYDSSGRALLVATVGIPLSRVSLETGRTTLIGDPRWAKFHIIAAW